MKSPAHANYTGSGCLKLVIGIHGLLAHSPFGGGILRGVLLQALQGSEDLLPLQ